MIWGFGTIPARVLAMQKCKVCNVASSKAGLFLLVPVAISGFLAFPCPRLDKQGSDSAFCHKS